MNRKRARKIVAFLENSRYDPKRLHKIFYPFRKWSYMNRVLKNNGQFNDADLEAWEVIIKKLKKVENTRKVKERSY